MMASRKIKTRTEDKAKAFEYLKKAEDNYAGMLRALEERNYNAAGTLAVQCAISAADAACVHEKGIRSTSDDHREVCEIVDSLPLKEAKDKCNLLKRILAQKNLIQYESRNIHQKEAGEIAKSAERFYQWVHSAVNK